MNTESLLQFLAEKKSELVERHDAALKEIRESKTQIFPPLSDRQHIFKLKGAIRTINEIVKHIKDVSY